MSSMDRWSCPNDRQLALRAKLGAGWSVHTSKMTSLSRNDQLTNEETEHILSVIRQAEMLEQCEMERIGVLVDKLESMKNNALGNGSSHCILCGDGFGILGASPQQCVDCQKAVCSKCGVDTIKGPSRSQHTVWLCKICSENRELWKRSGAWFYKGLPRFIRPPDRKGEGYDSPRNNRVGGSNVVRPIRNIGGGVSVMKGTVATWNKANHKRGERGESDGSSESEDEIKISRRRVKPTVVDSGDSDSVDSARFSAYSESSSTGGGIVSSSSQWGMSAGGPEDALNRVDSTRSKGVTEGQGRKKSGSGDVGQGGDFVERAPRKSRLFSQTSLLDDGGATLGSLEFSVIYDSTDLTLKCRIQRAQPQWTYAHSGLPAKDKNGLSDPYVKLHLLPSAGKSTKLRTTTKYKTLNPVWDETLVYDCVTDDDVLHKTLRLSVYDENTVGQEFIGETRVTLRSLKPGQLRDFNVYLSGFQNVTSTVVKMDRRLRVAYAMHLLLSRSQVDNAMDSALAAALEEERGRILIGLCYDSNKECLKVYIKKCSALKAMDSNGYSDPYVKLYLQPDPKKKSKAKTKVKSKTLNPEFNEEFSFPIKLPELAKKTLDVTVWDKDFGKFNDYIGGIQLGINSKGERLRHWYDTLKNPNKNCERWHFLSGEPLEKVPES